MKVNLSNDAALAAAAAAGAAKSERSSNSGPAASTALTAAGTAAVGVPVSMSASARALDATSAGSGIDESKVAAMRAAIAGGTFKVDASAIADKLLSNAQEFLTRSGS